MSDPGSLLQAFVLHRRDYGDTSLLVEMFAIGRGRLPVIAKGARRAHNPVSALLQPFQPLWLGVVGRGEVRTLTRVEAAGPAIRLSGRPLLCGFYLNELLVRLLGREDPHDPLFAFYHAALVALSANDDLDTVLRQFEIRLLDELGYAMTLDVEASGGNPVDADGVYLFDPGDGARRAGPNAVADTLSGATLLALSKGVPLSPPQAREARALLRRVLEPHLGGRPLQSRELFRRWSAIEGVVRRPSATRAPLPQADAIGDHEGES